LKSLARWAALHGVVVILFIMSIWSIAVMFERWFTFRAAKKQSREFARPCRGPEGR